jgi:hypothetical protein
MTLPGLRRFYMGLGAVGALCFTLVWWTTPDTAPAMLERTSGPISSTEAVESGYRGRRLSTVLVSIEGSPHRFGYHDSAHGGIREAWEVIARGRTATVLHTPPTASGRVKVWGMAIDGRTLVTPQVTLERRQSDGQGALMYALMCAAFGVAAWYALQRPSR